MLQQCLCLATYFPDSDRNPWTGHSGLISGCLHNHGLAWWSLWQMWLPLLDVILTCRADFLAWPQAFLINKCVYLAFWLNLVAVSRCTSLISLGSVGLHQFLMRTLPLPTLFPYWALCLLFGTVCLCWSVAADGSSIFNLVSRSLEKYVFMLVLHY